MKILRPWTTTLHLNSTSPKTSTREDESYILITCNACVVLATLGVYSSGAPPLIYIGGSHPLLGWELSALHLEPTLASNGETPRGRRKAEGPMGRRLTLLVVRSWAGPTCLLLWPSYWHVDPLVHGGWRGSTYVGLLYWWALQSMWCLCGSVWLDGVLLLGSKGTIAFIFSWKPALIKFQRDMWNSVIY